MPQNSPFKLTNPIPTEHDECVCLLQWAEWKRHKGFRVSDFLVMIPNGAQLAGDVRQRSIQMARLKAQGFKVGVSDYFLALKTPTYGGLWIEVKRTKLGIVSEAQNEFIDRMRAAGYQAAVARGWEQAKSEIETYLEDVA